MNIKFEKASVKHYQTILVWLEEEHVKEFWDNSQEYKDDILNFINGRKEPSQYFDRTFSYWLGVVEEKPYSLIMTSEFEDAVDLPGYYKPYLSKNGKTFGLDFCIGSKEFIGKGLAAPTLVEFMEFFSTNIEPKADTYIIDPYINNPRPIHVYQKAGFQIEEEFTCKEGYFKGSNGVVMVKKL